MALTIVATAGSASANSYVTEAEVIAYVASRLNPTDWITTSGATCTETEKTALIEATRDLSTLAWLGWRTDDTQALAWPREDVANPDSSTGFDYATTIVPQRVKDATCELAVQFIKAGTTDIANESASDGVIRKTVDVLTTEWAAPGMRARGLNRYRSVMRFLRPLLASSGGMNSTIERG